MFPYITLQMLRCRLSSVHCLGVFAQISFLLQISSLCRRLRQSARQWLVWLRTDTSGLPPFPRLDQNMRFSLRKQIWATTPLTLAIALILISASAHAGDFHVMKEKSATGITETLACSQCHTMHGSQGGASMTYNTSPPGTYPKLLRAASILQLCLFCHGPVSPGPVEFGRTPPQVMNNTAFYASIGQVASAGDFNSGGVLNEANRHSVGLTFGVDLPASGPPGYVGDWTQVTNRYSTTFNCEYCHDQHGNRNFRNLRYDPGNPSQSDEINGVIVNYNRTETLASGKCSDGSNAPCDVSLTTDGAYDTSNNRVKYYRSNVQFRRAANDDKKKGIAAFCGRCHTKFFGISEPYGNEATGPYLGGNISAGVGASDSDATNPWRRHPVADDSVGVGDTNKHTDLPNWSSIAAAARTRHIDPDGTPGNSDDQPFCLTCHYVHGGGNPNNSVDPTLDHSILAMRDSSGKLNLEPGYDANSSRIRHVCQQCHNQ